MSNQSKVNPSPVQTANVLPVPFNLTAWRLIPANAVFEIEECRSAITAIAELLDHCDDPETLKKDDDIQYGVTYILRLLARQIQDADGQNIDCTSDDLSRLIQGQAEGRQCL